MDTAAPVVFRFPHHGEVGYADLETRPHRSYIDWPFSREEKKDLLMHAYDMEYKFEQLAAEALREQCVHLRETVDNLQSKLREQDLVIAEQHAKLDAQAETITCLRAESQSLQTLVDEQQHDLDMQASEIQGHSSELRGLYAHVREDGAKIAAQELELERALRKFNDVQGRRSEDQMELERAQSLCARQSVELASRAEEAEAHALEIRTLSEQLGTSRAEFEAQAKELTSKMSALDLQERHAAMVAAQAAQLAGQLSQLQAAEERLSGQRAELQKELAAYTSQKSMMVHAGGLQQAWTFHKRATGKEGFAAVAQCVALGASDAFKPKPSLGLWQPCRSNLRQGRFKFTLACRGI